jgi:tetratricopeptide (TPR) repeat protein
MSHPELRQLTTRAEQLFDAGKLEEALELFNELIQINGLENQHKNHIQFLKGLILTYQYKTEELIEMGEQVYEEGKKLNNTLQSFDGLFFMLIGLCLAFEFEDVFRLIKKAETLLKLISKTSKNFLLQNKVRLSLIKAWVNFYIGDVDLAEKCTEWVLEVHKELGDAWEIVWANTFMTQIKVFGRSSLDLAVKYNKNALKLARGIKFNHYWIATCHGYFGAIYISIGEIDKSLKHYKKSLKLAEGLKSDYWSANLLNNIGNAYAELGDYDTAMKYLENSLKLWESKPINIKGVLDSIIAVALKKGDNVCAQKYFHRLENLYNQKKDKDTEFLYKYNQALMLKASSRIRDKAKVEVLLKQVIETESSHFDILISAHIHLCDLLLAEYRINNNSEVLDEVDRYSSQLLTIAEKQHSYLVFCESFILLAKLALLKLDVKAARRFLTQAQKIAESYGIKRLAKKISYEHDKLLKQQDNWNDLKESKAPISERWKFAGLKEQMEIMVKKRMIEVPEITDEESVLLLIVSDGGILLFSHSFIEESSVDSKIFSGLLTTIDYFIREMFSEGLDRATFGEYTLLMKSIPPFFISYIFKGDSYYAIQKTIFFIENIQKEEVIWQNLLKSFQLNQSIHLKDIPLLESLITEIFITKSIKFSEL